MKNQLISMTILSCFLLVGCETVHEGTKKAGTYVGKGVSAAGGLTEGAAEGYAGTELKDKENPYGR